MKIPKICTIWRANEANAMTSHHHLLKEFFKGHKAILIFKIRHRFLSKNVNVACAKSVLARVIHVDHHNLLESKVTTNS